MATNFTINGVSYPFPQTGDQNWGDNVTNWAAAVSSGLLQKAGGAFTLTAEVDFGTTYGLKSAYFKSRATNPAAAGQVRLGTAEVIAWRNNANGADLPLTTDASDNLLFNGHIITGSAGVVPVASGGTGLTSYTTGDMLYASGATTLAKVGIGAVTTILGSTGTAPQWGQLVNAQVSASAAIAYSKLALTGAILNADLAGSIARSKLLAGSINQVVINDGSGNLSSEANLATSRGGTGVGSVTTAPAASSFAGWDANKNLSANSFISAYTSTPTAAATTALLVSSTGIQVFTGATTQTVTMPVVSGLVTGMQWTLINLSSGVVTVQSSGANTIQAMAANTQLVLTCISTSGTGTASWNWVYSQVQASVPLTNPMTTGGDIIYGAGGGTPTRLANGTSGQYLKSTGGTTAPAWTGFTAPTVQKLTSTGTQTGWAFTVTSANATAGATYTNNGQTFTVLGTIAAATLLFCSGTGATSGGTLTKSAGTGDATITFSSKVATATYTPTASTILYAKVRLVGGGGGAGASGTGSSGSTAGGDTYLGANILIGGGGTAGAAETPGGQSTASFTGSGVSGVAFPGTGGGNGSINNTTAYSLTIRGGDGGASPFGGAGIGIRGSTTNAAANTGSGGGAAHGYNTATYQAGGGGGAGGYVDVLVTGSTLAAWIASGAPYVVGAGGTGGTGTIAGGNGGTGVILIEEFYQ